MRYWQLKVLLCAHSLDGKYKICGYLIHKGTTGTRSLHPARVQMQFSGQVKLHQAGPRTVWTAPPAP